MSENKLLPCPFCGGEAREYGNAKVIGTKIKHYQLVVCMNDDCGCRTGLCETVADAIHKWNTRKPMDDIVEQLKEEKYMDRSKVYTEAQCTAIRFSFGRAINIVQSGGKEN